MFCRQFESPDVRDDPLPSRPTVLPAAAAPAMNARGRIGALVAVALVAGALFWAMQAVVRHNAVQNCIDSGRRDCRDPPAP